MEEDLVRECVQWWENPLPRIARIADEGGRPVAYFCSYVPEEVLHAAGLTPVRLMGSMRTISHADAHLQAYCCSVARTDLDMALAGELSFLEGAVFVQTCDTMMRLSDIWRRNVKLPFHGDLVLPVRMGEEISLPFMVREVERFKGQVEVYLGSPVRDEAIWESIRVYNQNRFLAEEIYRWRAENPGAVDALSAAAVLMAGFWMRKEEHNSLLQRFLDGLRAGETAAAPGSVRLFVTGSVCTTPDLYRLLSELGADVVDDDLCTGHRYFDAPVEDKGSPEEALAARLWRRVNCPSKHQSLEDRANRLVDQVKESGAQGVVFYLQSFCEPHLFDVPFLRKKLQEEAGVPSLVLETELQSFSRGQLRTRLQAFIETIAGV